MLNRMRTHFLVFRLFILQFVIFNGSIQAHQCYVCGSDGQPNCDQFSPKDSAFIQDCIADRASCSLQTKGGKVIARSCENGTILHDCKTANRIQYCYCAQELCNDRVEMSDDEDIEEGSGISIVTTVIHPTSPPNRSNQNEFYTLLHLFMIPALLYCM